VILSGNAFNDGECGTDPVVFARFPNGENLERPFLFVAVPGGDREGDKLRGEEFGEGGWRNLSSLTGDLTICDPIVECMLVESTMSGWILPSVNCEVEAIEVMYGL